MKKKIVSILLSILFVLSFGACGESEERKQIEELKALISAQSQTIAELNGTLSSLQTSIQTQGESIEELQATVNAQAEEIKLLRFHSDILAGLYTGDFYEIDEAYEKGVIDLEILKNISYHTMGGLFYGEQLTPPEERVQVEFTPLEEKPTLNPVVKVFIEEVYRKKTGYLSFKVVGSLGQYGDCYAVKMNAPDSGLGGPYLSTAGIIRFDYPWLKVFVLKKI